MTVIEPIFPVTGRNIVEPISWFQIRIADEDGVSLTDVDVFLSIGAQSDPAYPVSPNYYGSTIARNILTSLDTIEDPIDSGFFRVGYGGGTEFTYEEIAAARSTANQVSPSEIILDVRLEQPLGYNVEHFFRIRANATTQVLQFNTIPRPFFSPAIGDVQSDFEAAVQTPTYASVLPESHKLQRQAMVAFDDRDPILATRRLVRIALQRQLGFPDLSSEALQIRNRFRPLVFDEVAAPKSLAQIDQSLGPIALRQAERALKELASKKGIPTEWWQPVVNALDFVRIDLTYRVRVIAQTVAIAARASFEGRV